MPYKGDVVELVIEVAYEVLDIFDGIKESLGEMKELALSKDEQRIFAAIALNWKYDAKGEGKNIPLTPDDVLQTRREEDKPNDLWTTYQRVQENMIKGVVWGKNAKGKHQRTRPVNGIDGDVKLNRALWEMAEKMKELKS